MGDFDFVTVAGTGLNNSGGVWTGTASSFDYTLTESTGDLLVAVLEPSTCAALAGALALVGTIIYRRRRS